MLNNQGRPTGAGETSAASHKTFTGNRALQMEEALIFETGRLDVTGIDVEEVEAFTPRLGGLERKSDMKKRGVSSPDMGDALALTFAYSVVPRSIARQQEERASSTYHPIWG